MSGHQPENVRGTNPPRQQLFRQQKNTMLGGDVGGGQSTSECDIFHGRSLGLTTTAAGGCGLGGDRPCLVPGSADNNWRRRRRGARRAPGRWRRCATSARVRGSCTRRIYSAVMRRCLGVDKLIPHGQYDGWRGGALVAHRTRDQEVSASISGRGAAL